MPPAELPLFPDLDPGPSRVLTTRAHEDMLTAELVEYCSRFQLPAVLPDTIEAADAWGANCGPMSLAAVLGLTTVEAVHDFVRPEAPRGGGRAEFRGWMSPTDMLTALAEAARAGLVERFQHAREPTDPWPVLGLVRIQWLGPWCAPGVNPRAAYRYTHFIGVRTVSAGHLDVGKLPPVVMVYDATPNRWIPLSVWERWCPVLWPKRATGWAPVNRIDVTPRTGPKGQAE